jgi:hypothetical protein
MIRDQLPITDEAVARAVASPWRHGRDAGPEPEQVEASVAVVGPAALMTVLSRGATRAVADALGEALRGPELDVDEYTDSCHGWRGPELPRVTPATAGQLRAIATAAQAFTDTYLHVLAHQAYSFDPESYLEPRWRVEVAHAVLHLGLIGAHRRLTCRQVT